jgi:imidazolonepropionase-like amidohydrolase
LSAIDSEPLEVKPARRRLHVPTSVLLTVLLAALSVWVAPAFTRQWEDRKQARQLQAQIAEQVALATADLGQRINSFARAENLTGLTESELVKEYWQLKQAGIDVRLRAYFSPDMRLVWRTFNEFVEHEIGVVEMTKYVPPGDTGDAYESEKDWVEDLLQQMNSLGRASGVEPPFGDPAEASEAWMARYESDPASAMGMLFAWMRGFVDKIVDRVMSEDPEAFSTTRGDLLRDLLP